MGVETEIKEPSLPKSTEGKEKPRKKRLAKIMSLKEDPAFPPQELKMEEEPIKKIEIEGLSVPAVKKEWFEEPAGQLAIDVFQTEQDLIIQTAIAGIKPGKLEVTVERDIVAIRGIREKPSKEEGDYFTKECYWGPFAREIIVPVEIDPDRVEAIMQEGVLTVRMPKILREKKRIITVKA